MTCCACCSGSGKPAEDGRQDRSQSTYSTREDLVPLRDRRQSLVDKQVQLQTEVEEVKRDLQQVINQLENLHVPRGGDKPSPEEELRDLLQRRRRLSSRLLRIVNEQQDTLMEQRELQRDIDVAINDLEDWVLGP